MKTEPIVSVICSAYNSQKYIEQSVASILAQTFVDFEFIIFNDGSTDNTHDILETLKSTDERVVIVHQENAGLTPTLNRGLAMAKGKYVARQDDDDLSLPGRLEAQVAYMDRHPNNGVVGTRYESIDEHNNVIGKSNVPLSTAKIRRALLTHNVIAHSGAMFRKQMALDMGGYDERYRTAQDYALWCNFAAKYDVANLKATFLQRRLHAGQIGQTKSAQQIANRNQIRKEYRSAIMNAELSLPGSRLLKALSRFYSFKDKLLGG